MQLLQNDRLLRVTTALGPDKFLLRRLTVTEALDQPYQIQGELISAGDGTDIKATDLVGTAITCSVVQPEAGLERHFHGIVSRFGTGDGTLLDHRIFHFDAVPAAWLLNRSMDCRIFQDKTVQAIIDDIVNERGVGPVTFTHMPTTPRPYCTQFNESDLDFVQRVLDEAGCSYFFAQTDSSDGWTIIGDAAGFPTHEGTLTVRADLDRPDAVAGWTALNVVQPSRHKAWDFDNLKPSALLQAEAPTRLTTKEATGKLEVYRWPGGQAVRPDTARATPDLRMTRHEAAAETYTGHSLRAALAAGQKVSISDSVLGGGSKTWLVTAITHQVLDETSLVEGGTAEYRNSFTCIDSATPWRSPLRRPRPVIAGVQSAIVTGPSGEEIYTDEYGRVKLHFLWDHRDEKKDDTSSCWVRCMQSYAGAHGGMWVLPRIGDEVLVAFQDGDPDRPIVIGSVYNADGKPPWNLSNQTHATRYGIRGRSTPNGSRETANIVGFDDKKDSEQFYIQAQKDYLELVKNQKKVTIKGNEIRDVTGESQDQSDGKRTTTVKGDESLEVKQGNRITKVKQGDETHEVTQGKRTTTINGDETLEVKQGNREATIKMGNETLTVSMGNMEIKVSMGNISIKADLGSITIEAMQGITLKGGPTSTIEIAPTGISFKALKISTAADLMNDTKGAIEQQSGQGMQKVGGAITMIG